MALPFPSIIPETQEFGIAYNTQVSNSTISGIAQTVEMPGARWRGSLSFRDMTPSESAELKAFMMRLRGSSGRFFYGDVAHTSPFNTITGSPTVEVTSTNRIVQVTTTSGIFSVGDYIQIGNDDQRELKMVVASAQQSGLTYDLTIEPAIRRTDFIGLPVVYTNPTGVFLLNTSDQAKWATRSKALLSDMSLEFIEIFQ